MIPLGNIQQVVKQGSDLFVLYTFLKKLTTPFEETKAYELGIIDSNGKILRKRSTLNTSEEKSAYTLMDTLIFNIKKIMAKVPFGGSRIASYAASLFLLKESKNYKFLINEDVLEEKFLDFYKTNYEQDHFLFEATSTLKLFESIEEEIVDEEPANSAGGGGIAGIGVGPDGEPGGISKLQKKKQNQLNKFMIKPSKFIVIKNYKEHVESFDELKILAGLDETFVNINKIIPNTDIILVNDKTLEELIVKV